MRPIIAFIALGLLVTTTACSRGSKESFRNVDHDADGKISYEELLFVFPSVTRETVLELDTDHDGTLSENEYDRFVQNDAARKAGEKSAPPASAVSGTPAEAANGSQPAVPYTGEDVIEVAPPTNAANRPAAPSDKGKTDKKTIGRKGQASPQKSGEATRYTVVRGDNLSRIARRFGVTVDAIVRANGNMQPDTLRDGQVITIPARP